MKTVANFSVQFVQYLDSNTNIVNTLPDFAQNNKELLALYEAMLLARVFDNKVTSMHRSGQIGTYTGTLGQEAVGAGIGSCLTPDDIFVPYYRSTVALFQRGIRPHEILLFWGGDERGSDFKSEIAKQDLPIPICVGSQTLHAAGVATAIKLRKESHRAVLTEIGDGGTSQGDFYEALNVAGTWQLPLVFVINNNQWAISESNQQQTHCETFAQKAIAAGFEGIQVDGNDVIAVKAVTEQALNKARSGAGPTLIEAVTYRLCPHTTLDDMSRYTNDDELKTAWEEEPLLRLQNYLCKENLLDETDINKLTTKAEEIIETEVELYQSMEPQAPQAMFDYLYATLPEALETQRNEALLFGEH